MAQPLSEKKSSNRQKISIVIPVYREEDSIGKIVAEVKSLGLAEQIIVVDDGSDDRTAEMARQAGAQVITHPYNMGNGAAVKSGIRRACGDYILLMDGDGQHPAAEISHLLAEIGRYDLIVGARQSSGHASLLRYFANSIYNLFASYVCHFKIKDLTSGFRLVRTSLAKKIVYLLPNTFSYPSTMTLVFLKAGHSLKYVPIAAAERKTAKSKVRLFRDGARFFMIITKIAMLVSPLRIFLPVSLALALGAFGNYIYTFTRFHRFTNMSVLLGTSSVMILMLGLMAEQIALLRMDSSEDEQI